MSQVLTLQREREEAVTSLATMLLTMALACVGEMSCSLNPPVCHAILGPNNTAHLLTFLSDLSQRCTDRAGTSATGAERAVSCDHVSSQWIIQAREWFDDVRVTNLFLTPYSPFVKPTEEFFSAWQ